MIQYVALKKIIQNKTKQKHPHRQERSLFSVLRHGCDTRAVVCHPQHPNEHDFHRPPNTLPPAPCNRQSVFCPQWEAFPECLSSGITRSFESGLALSGMRLRPIHAIV